MIEPTDQVLEALDESHMLVRDAVGRVCIRYVGNALPAPVRGALVLRAPVGHLSVQRRSRRDDTRRRETRA